MYDVINEAIQGKFVVPVMKGCSALNMISQGQQINHQHFARSISPYATSELCALNRSCDMDFSIISHFCIYKQELW